MRPDAQATMEQEKDENQFREHQSQMYYDESEWAKLRVEISLI